MVDPLIVSDLYYDLAHVYDRVAKLSGPSSKDINECGDEPMSILFLWQKKGRKKISLK